MSAYLILKAIHTTCALLSISGFILRGYWMLADSPMLGLKPVKIIPHIIDTFLLLSAIGLLFVLGFGLLSQSWLIHKIGLLVVYIILGYIALDSKYGKLPRAAAFVGGVLVFFYIVGIAINKTPLSWLVLVL